MFMSSPTSARTEQPPSPGLHFGHDECNLAEFPLSVLSDNLREGGKRVTSYTYEHEFIDPHGKLRLGRVELEGSQEHGLPTGRDDDVLLGLLYLSGLEGFQSRTLHFSRRQLLQLIRWSTQGTGYDRLEKSLIRWHSVKIRYHNWWDEVRQDCVSVGFSVLDNYVLCDDRRRGRDAAGQLDLPLSFIVWNKTPFANFSTKKLRDLDLDVLFSLPNPAARRAFRFLDKNLPAHGSQTYDLRTFACEHIGLSRAHKPSRLLKELHESIVMPLESAQIIYPVTDQKQRYPRQGRGRYHVIFARAGQPALPPPAAPAPEPASADEPSPLLKELRRHALGGKAARDLIAAHPAAYVEAKIDYLDYLIEASQRPKNPAGWLRTAIEDDYGPPAGYLPKAERQRKSQAAAEARQQKQREDEERRRQKEEEERKLQRERAEKAYALALFGELPEAEQHAIEAAAVADGDAESQSLREYARRRRHSAAWDIVITCEVLKRYPMPEPRP
jgi:hypothetical protein